MRLRRCCARPARTGRCRPAVRNGSRRSSPRATPARTGCRVRIGRRARARARRVPLFVDLLPARRAGDGFRACRAQHRQTGKPSGPADDRRKHRRDDPAPSRAPALEPRRIGRGDPHAGPDDAPGHAVAFGAGRRTPHAAATARARPLPPVLKSRSLTAGRGDQRRYPHAAAGGRAYPGGLNDAAATWPRRTASTGRQLSSGSARAPAVPQLRARFVTRFPARTDASCDARGTFDLDKRTPDER